MFTLKHSGFFHRKTRLRSAATLSAADFRKIADALHVAPRNARKIGRVAARKAGAVQRIETRWNGKESEVVAEPGDWIVTTLSPTGAVMRDAEGHVNTYAIKADRFAELYEPTTIACEHGAVFLAKGRVEAIFLSGGFEILAPWGEAQQSGAGYLLLNGTEVYGNAKETFEGTYEVEA